MAIYCQCLQAFGLILFNTYRVMHMFCGLKSPLQMSKSEHLMSKLKPGHAARRGNCHPSTEKWINMGSEWRQRIQVPCSSWTRKEGRKQRNMSKFLQDRLWRMETSWMESISEENLEAEREVCTGLCHRHKHRRFPSAVSFLQPLWNAAASATLWVFEHVLTCSPFTGYWWVDARMWVQLIQFVAVN